MSLIKDKGYMAKYFRVKNYIKTLRTLFFIPLLIVLLLCTACSGPADMTAGQPAAEGDTVLTIKGDGVKGETLWTLAQLQALTDGYKELSYSTTNNWPNYGHMSANGVSLPYLLAQAGIKSGASSFTFSSADGYFITLPYDQVFGAYYSYVNHGKDGSDGAFAIEPVIAWEWGDDGKTRPENLRPFFGQAGPNDVNTAAFVKDLCLIEVSTDPVGAWPAPGVSIAGGSVVPFGTELEFIHENMDKIKIYYTLDGSEPDYDSPVYNPSTSYYQPQLTKPLVLTEDVTIKAFAAGFGQEKSPVVAFGYKVSGPFAFLFLSDTQADPETGDYSGAGELLKQAVSGVKPELILFGGDTVDDGGDPDEWAAFWEAAAPCTDGIMTAAAAGNHDNYPVLKKQFDYPKEDDGFFYSFDKGGIHFTVLDSNIMGAADAKDIEWVRNDLDSEAARLAGWRIAVMHHPMWPPVGTAPNVQRAETMQEHFLPVLEAGGVDLILCGHQHVYARSTSASSIAQIVASSGDKDPYSANILEFVDFSEVKQNYIRMTADKEKLSITAYDKTGKAFDSYTLTARNSETRRIRVIGPGGSEAWLFDESMLAGACKSVYSTINNWPAPRFYAAEGYSVESILSAAGLLKAARTVTFRGEDGYSVSLTREQLLAPQFYYPNVGENGEGAEPVKTVIAYRWREGTDDPGKIRDDKPSLILGQRDPFEHTNPAFVVGVSEIIVSGEPCESWPLASTFPGEGKIPRGETVKLQHSDYGLVKLYYTTDGSDPTPLSAMYNPSTFRPELNAPIRISEPTVIKVMARGYGKNDSGVAVFKFTPVD